MRRSVASLAAVSCLLLLAACGQDDTSAADGSPESASPGATSPETTSPTPDAASPDAASPAAQRIEIAFEGDSVTPSGERVDVAVGQPIELVVTAEAPGELHVHSSPEQELEYDAGTTTLDLTIGRPGVVDVEAHDLELTIVQLEVR